MDDGKKKREEGHDGLVNEHNPGTEGANTELCSDRLGFCACYDVLLTSLPGQLLRTALEEHRSVGFWEGKGKDEPGREGRRCHKDNNATPTGVSVEKTTDDRAEVLAHESCQREDAEHKTTFLGVKHIGDDGRSHRLCEGTGQTSKEAKCDYRTHRCRKVKPSSEQDKCAERRDIELAAAVDLTQGRQNQCTDRKAKYESRCSHQGDNLINVELRLQVPGP